MNQSAHITSTEAVDRFKSSVQQFDAAVRDTLVQLVLEVRRAVDWIEQDRGRYWPREFRRASDAVIEARINLERCELAIDPDDRRGCYVEKKLLQKAKQRLATTEEKVRVVRQWVVKIKQEVDEFQVHIAKMNNYLDSQIPRAVAALQRMATALDRYTATSLPAETRRIAPDTGVLEPSPVDTANDPQDSP